MPNLADRNQARPLPLLPTRPFYLVGAARAVGEPLHLYCAAHRRRRRALRLWDHGVPPAAAEAQRVGPRIRAAARRHRDALRHRGDDDHVHVFIVGIFYCLDALHGERRDRSILFWKSLPVSDLTTVLSKVFVPLAILPRDHLCDRHRDAVHHADDQHGGSAPERPGWHHLEPAALAPAVG